MNKLKGPLGLGMYLGLTGARLGPGDSLLSGIATHFVRSEHVDQIMVPLHCLSLVDSIIEKFKGVG